MYRILHTYYYNERESRCLGFEAEISDIQGLMNEWEQKGFVYVDGIPLPNTDAYPAMAIIMHKPNAPEPMRLRGESTASWADFAGQVITTTVTEEVR